MADQALGQNNNMPNKPLAPVERAQVAIKCIAITTSIAPKKVSQQPRWLTGRFGL
jgi:hypothetical protein